MQEAAPSFDMTGASASDRGWSWTSAGRSVLAVLAGAVVAGLVISAVEAVSSVIYPPPADLDLHDPVALRQHVEHLPIGAFLIVLAAWALGSFSGAWVAARLTRRARSVHGWIVGAIFLLGGVLTMLLIPHPLWMWAGGIVALVGGPYLGARLADAGRASSGPAA